MLVFFWKQRWAYAINPRGTVEFDLSTKNYLNIKSFLWRDWNNIVNFKISYNILDIQAYSNYIFSAYSLKWLSRLLIMITSFVFYNTSEYI